LLKTALLGVVAQRLVRTLCERCKAPTEVTADQWQSLVAPMRARRPRIVQEAVGCDECRHTGFKGRMAIFEILRMTDPLRALITPSVDNRALRETAISEGMRPLRISGARKVQAGLTNAAEVIAVTQNDGPD